MANVWEKDISILAGNLNSGHSYLITTEQILVMTFTVFVLTSSGYIIHNPSPGIKRCTHVNDTCSVISVIEAKLLCFHKHCVVSFLPMAAFLCRSIRKRLQKIDSIMLTYLGHRCLPLILVLLFSILPTEMGVLMCSDCHRIQKRTLWWWLSGVFFHLFAPYLAFP
jgi:hypothetical protein